MKYVFRINWDIIADRVSVTWHDPELNRYVAKRYKYTDTKCLTPRFMCIERLQEFLESKTPFRHACLQDILEYSPSEFIAIIEVK